MMSIGFPVMAYNATSVPQAYYLNENTLVTIVGDKDVWANGIETNGICSYAYRLHEVVYGPVMQKAKTCDVSIANDKIYINGVETQ